MIRAILIALLLTACMKKDFVKGCEVLDDPVAYANCRITGLTK